MRRYGVAALAVTLMASGCATGTASGPDAPPYGALVSPTAAMEVVFNEVCLPAILENQSIETLALQRFMRPVGVRETGSDQAVAAWRLASYSEVYVMQLPNGGCSASVDAGDPDALNARALELLARGGRSPSGPPTKREAATPSTRPTARPKLIVPSSWAWCARPGDAVPPSWPTSSAPRTPRRAPQFCRAH